MYLADYGLSYRYCPTTNHKEYKENPKKGHNGTMEYTSLDAHKGVSKSWKFISRGMNSWEHMDGPCVWGIFLKLHTAEAAESIMD